MEKSRLPLEGVRVLDLTGSYAGPFCTMLLGDLGADVVKVEEPDRGDDIRHWGGEYLFEGVNPWFFSTNRNKRGISLNIRDPKGFQVLERLIEKADVFIVSMSMKALERLGISYEKVASLNPRVVYCSLTGYGHTGPYTHRPCYDLISEGVGGIMGVTGDHNHPEKVGTPAGDILAAHAACISIIACLYRRNFTGLGDFIDVCLVDSVVSFVTPKLVSYLATGQMFEPDGNRCTPIAVYQPVRTKDGFLNMDIGNDRIWERVKKLLGLEDVFSDGEYADNEGRRRHRAEIVSELEKVLMTRETKYWFDYLSEKGVPCGPIYYLHEVAKDPHIRARGMIFNIEDEEFGAIPQVGPPWKLACTEQKRHRRPPKIGEHDEEVYAEWLELKPEVLEDLRGSKTIM